MWNEEPYFVNLIPIIFVFTFVYSIILYAFSKAKEGNILDQYPEKVAELKDIMVREHRPDPNWPLLKEEKAK